MVTIGPAIVLPYHVFLRIRGVLEPCAYFNVLTIVEITLIGAMGNPHVYFPSVACLPGTQKAESSPIVWIFVILNVEPLVGIVGDQLYGGDPQNDLSVHHGPATCGEKPMIAQLANFVSLRQSGIGDFSTVGTVRETHEADCRRLDPMPWAIAPGLSFCPLFCSQDMRISWKPRVLWPMQAMMCA
jgi:hypothetical protein